jgi:hypothetical protein
VTVPVGAPPLGAHEPWFVVVESEPLANVTAPGPTGWQFPSAGSATDPGPPPSSQSPLRKSVAVAEQLAPVRPPHAHAVQPRVSSKLVAVGSTTNASL